MKRRSLLPLGFVTLGLALALLLLPAHPAVIAAAQPQGWVELVDERTRTSKTYADLNQPGRTKWFGSVAKIHYDGPDWKDIDNSIIPSNANVPTLGLVDLEMTTDDYEFYALQTLNTIPLWFYRNKSLPDTYVTFNPQALQWTNDLDQLESISMPQSVLGAVSENRLHWADAYGPGRDLTLSAQAGRLSKLLTLNIPPPAPAQYILDGGNPALELRFIFDTPSGPEAPDIVVDGTVWGQSARTETINAIEFEIGGQFLFAFASPIAYDSGLDSTQATFILTKQGPNLRVAIRVPLSFLEAATYPVFIDPTVDEQVGASGDDGISWGASAFSNTNAGQFMGRDGSGSFYDNFARFTTVNIGQGAAVATAYITVEASSTADDGVGVKSNIFGNDADDATAPTTRGEHDGKGRTTAFTAWDDEDFAVDTPTNSPSIASVIEEIVGRPGWVANNDLMILWDEDSGTSTTGKLYRLYSYDGSSAKAMKLHIESWANTAPTITTTPETTGTVDVAYSQLLQATDPDTNQTLVWEINATDADFLSIESLNRSAYVNGTPTAEGTFYINVTVGDEWNGNTTDYVNWTLTVSEVTAIFGTATNFIIALAVFVILLILGFVLHPVSLIMAGIIGFFLAIVSYDATGEIWASVGFVFIGILVLLAGGFKARGGM